MSNRYRDGKKRKGLCVEVKNDDFTRALRTLGKKVQDSGLLKEVRDRTAFEKPAVRKQRLKKQARKRWEKQVEEMIARGQWLRGKNY